MTTDRHHPIVAAASADAARRLAGRADQPDDLGPARDPDRASLGWRRWGFLRLGARPAAAPPPASDTILARVRKLLTLAGNHAASEGEASNAAAAAQRLIEQYRLDAALLDAGDTDGPPPPPEPIGIAPDPFDLLKSRVAWRGSLASGIARVNACKMYWHRGYGSGGRYEIRVIGAPSRVASVRHLYAYLSREVDRLGAAAAVGRGRAYGHAWRVGCAERVAERLAEAATAGQAEAKRLAVERGASLVRVERAALTIADERQRVLAWQRANVRLTAGRATRVGDASGYSDGKAAGDRIRLGGHAALGGGAARLGGGSAMMTSCELLPKTSEPAT